MCLIASDTIDNPEVTRETEEEEDAAHILGTLRSGLALRGARLAADRAAPPPQNRPPPNDLDLPQDPCYGEPCQHARIYGAVTS